MNICIVDESCQFSEIAEKLESSGHKISIIKNCSQLKDKLYSSDLIIGFISGLHSNDHLISYLLGYIHFYPGKAVFYRCRSSFNNLYSDLKLKYVEDYSQIEKALSCKREDRQREINKKFYWELCL